MLPKSWKPAPTADLVRLGSEYDGGYLVSAAAVDAATLLLSMGLNSDWGFEEDYLARNPKARVVCFDHSVTAGFWRWHTLNGLVKFSPKHAVRYFAYRRFFGSARAEHRLIKIGYDEPGGVSLTTLLAEMPDDVVFLKMDIEGSEYRVLDQIVAHKSRFSGMVIEFHDIDLHRQRVDDFLTALDGFTPVELHPNNYGGTDAAGDPLVIEISLTRNDLCKTGANAQAAATALAKPCNPNQPDIHAAYEAA